MSNRQRRWLIIGGIALGVLLIGGVFLYIDWFGIGGPQSTGEISAPELVANDIQDVVYRIEPTLSEVRYAVDEIFAGNPVSTAVGVTNTVAGDVLINTVDPSQISVGPIVINIELFESNSGLRDARIRQEFLESSTYPEATFVPIEILDFPDNAAVGVPSTFQMRGDLTIKETTSEVVWDVTATLDGDVLTGQASTVVLMSTFDVGPISIAGFVETSDELDLTFDFVAISTEAEVDAVLADLSAAEADDTEVVAEITDATSEMDTTTDLAEMSAAAEEVMLDAVPGITVTMTPDRVSGVNVQVTLENFVLAPEQIGQANEDGTGHAYLFVDGERYMRVVTEWIHIDDLSPNAQQLTVALAQNDGTLLAYEGDVVSSEVDIAEPSS
jgi:polyisoprenoid-binding protein YceI